MSMMKTLAKVAIGVAVAKGVSGLMKKNSGGQTASRGQVGEGGLFGGVHSPQAQTRSGSGSGGLEDLLGAVLGGKPGAAPSGQPGGLGGLLEQLGGARAGAGHGGSGAPGGGLNDLLKGLVGDRAPAPSLGDDETASAGPGGGFGDLLNQAIARQDEPETPPSRDQEAMAALMLRAMIMAMKSDGQIDAGEHQKLMGRLGDVSREEQAFVENELRQPVDANAIARDVPRGLEAQVYAMSVMGIDLDNQNEAKYLHELAQAMGVEPSDVNDIHDQMGVPHIYA